MAGAVWTRTLDPVTACGKWHGFEAACAVARADLPWRGIACVGRGADDRARCVCARSVRVHADASTRNDGGCLPRGGVVCAQRRAFPFADAGLTWKSCPVSRLATNGMNPIS